MAASKYILGAGVAAIMVLVAVNAAYFQDGPHPAPIFGAHIAQDPGEDLADISALIAALEEPPDRRVERLLGNSRKILELQRILADLGFGPLRIDGVFGAETKAALRRFERQRGLPESGVLTLPLLAELEHVLGRRIAD